MDNSSIFLFSAAIALFSFFVAAPCLLNAISLFGVQKHFAQTMVAEGVVSQETVDQLHPKKQLAGVLISLVVFGGLTFVCVRQWPWGPVSGVIALIGGLMKYRQILEFNSLTVKRFRNSYAAEMDSKKFNRYVDRTF